MSNGDTREKYLVSISGQMTVEIYLPATTSHMSLVDWMSGNDRLSFEYCLTDTSGVPDFREGWLGKSLGPKAQVLKL
jgi:hypothetical protein